MRSGTKKETASSHFRREFDRFLEHFNCDLHLHFWRTAKCCLQKDCGNNDKEKYTSLFKDIAKYIVFLCWDFIKIIMIGTQWQHNSSFEILASPPLPGASVQSHQMEKSTQWTCFARWNPSPFCSIKTGFLFGCPTKTHQPHIWVATPQPGHREDWTE